MFFYTGKPFWKTDVKKAHDLALSNKKLIGLIFQKIVEANGRFFLFFFCERKN